MPRGKLLDWISESPGTMLIIQGVFGVTVTSNKASTPIVKAKITRNRGIKVEWGRFATMAAITRRRSHYGRAV